MNPQKSTLLLNPSNIDVNYKYGLSLYQLKIKKIYRLYLQNLIHCTKATVGICYFHSNGSGYIGQYVSYQHKQKPHTLLEKLNLKDFIHIPHDPTWPAKAKKHSSFSVSMAIYVNHIRGGVCIKTLSPILYKQIPNKSLFFS